MKKKLKHFIAGPCSAETREQTLETARELSKIEGISMFRAGIWKPRTSPGSFEGVGKKGLSWLQEVKENYGFKTTTEVATSKHVEQCLNHSIDALWIGARTTVNPFYVQEIADSLKGVDIPVFVKNPISPDVGLWIGAIARLKKSGINNISVIHRGFYSYSKGIYRNSPMWEIPVKLKTEFPELDVICDPSHIAGDSRLILEVSKLALHYGMNGLMIETHPNPKDAWSDSSQQVTPNELQSIIRELTNSRLVEKYENEELDFLRQEINSSDDILLGEIAKRLEIVKKIANLKKNNSAKVFQLERWKIVLDEAKNRAKELNLNPDFIEDLMNIIHKESLNIHHKIYKS